MISKEPPSNSHCNDLNIGGIDVGPRLPRSQTPTSPSCWTRTSPLDSTLAWRYDKLSQE